MSRRAARLLLRLYGAAAAPSLWRWLEVIMMRQKISRHSALVAVAFLALAGDLAAQAPSSLPGVFGEVLDVRVVNLEIVVTDRDGVPVRGLGAADFRLLVDGAEVPIDYFSEVRGGVAVEMGEGAPPAVGALAAGQPVGTSYLVFLDEFFTLPTDRDRVINSLIEELPLLAPEDRMAIVAFDGDDLEMLSSWSQSQAELRRVLMNTRLRKSRGLQRLAERRALNISDVLPVGALLGDGVQNPGTIRTQLSPEERFYVQRLSEQLDRTVAAAAATLRSFAKPPGRKVMLLLSGGWPYLPTDYLLEDFNRLILDREGLEGDDLYGRLVDTANLLGYTIYPIDAPGLDRELVDTGVGLGAPDGAAGARVVREQELHYTLHYLAEQTGGKAFLNANRTKGFSGAVSDTRSYYWIGFTPQREWDDRRHRVEVKTVNDGYRARSREGFLDSSRSREVTMQVESALLFGNAPGQGELGVTVGAVQRLGRKRMDVELQLLIPLEQLTFLPVGERWATQLELRVAVRDAEGRRAEIPVVPLELLADGQPVAGQVGRYQTTLRLRRLAHQAVVAVYDPASGRILSSGVEIAP